MVAEFLQNPRRSPRAPLRCRTAVVSAHGSFEATTEDIGGHGCQLVSPKLVRKGEPVQLVVSHEAAQPLRIGGRVAWASDRAPWRLGIAYDESALAQSQAWFDGLLARVPGLAAFRRIPERIPLDAVVYLATPPRFLVDFMADEVALLRALGSGISVAELRALLRDHWPQVQRALFSLLAHQHVTLSRGASVHPDAWRKILSEAEASLAVESLRNAPLPDVAPPPPPPPTAPAVPAQAAPPLPAWGSAVPPAVSPPWLASAASPAIPVPPEPARDAPADWLVTAAEMAPTGWPAHGAPAVAPPAPRGVERGIDGGVSWSTPPPLTGGAERRSPSRPAEAQGCYDRALAELEAGRRGSAMALLRRALALAPGDPEIAGALARMMKGG